MNLKEFFEVVRDAKNHKDKDPKIKLQTSQLTVIYVLIEMALNAESSEDFIQEDKKGDLSKKVKKIKLKRSELVSLVHGFQIWRNNPK